MSGAISEYTDQIAHAGDGGYDKAALWPKHGYPDLRPSGDVIAELTQKLQSLEQRIAHLETMLHQHLNRTEGEL